MKKIALWIKRCIFKAFEKIINGLFFCMKPIIRPIRKKIMDVFMSALDQSRLAMDQEIRQHLDALKSELQSNIRTQTFALNELACNVNNITFEVAAIKKTQIKMDIIQAQTLSIQNNTLRNIQTCLSSAKAIILTINNVVPKIATMINQTQTKMDLIQEQTLSILNNEHLNIQTLMSSVNTITLNISHIIPIITLIQEIKPKIDLMDFRVNLIKSGVDFTTVETGLLTAKTNEIYSSVQSNVSVLSQLPEALTTLTLKVIKSSQQVEQEITLNIDNTKNQLIEHLNNTINETNQTLNLTYNSIIKTADTIDAYIHWIHKEVNNVKSKIDDTNDEVAQTIQSAMSDVTSEVNLICAEINTIKSKTESVSEKTVISEENNPTNIATENDFFDFWTHINIHLKHWEECDIILTCPATHHGATVALGNKKLFLLNQFSDFYDFYYQHKDIKVKSIGVISPWVLNELIKKPICVSKLMQLCSVNLVMSYRTTTTFNTTSTLTVLHKTGFSSILTLFHNNDMNFCSLPVSSDGQYQYYAKTPGISNTTGNWITHLAYRMNFDMLEKFQWSCSLGFIERIADNQLRALPNQLAIAIKPAEESFELSAINYIIIQASFSWKELAPGHSSLISCYDGCDDSNMYALLVSLSEINTIELAIWKNNKEWIQLKSILIKTSESKISLWLKTTPEWIIGGTEDKELLRVKDNTILRNHTLGVRLFSDTIGLSDIQTQYCHKDE